MGIAVEGPAFIFGDNKSVSYNSSIADSVPKKKVNAIAYHFVREGSTSDKWRVKYIRTDDDNVANMLTKPLEVKRKRENDFLVWYCIMHFYCNEGEHKFFFSQKICIFVSFPDNVIEFWEDVNKKYCHNKLSFLNLRGWQLLSFNQHHWLPNNSAIKIFDSVCDMYLYFVECIVLTPISKIEQTLHRKEN